jgi:hypothetical protein
MRLRRCSLAGSTDAFADMLSLIARLRAPPASA